MKLIQLDRCPVRRGTYVEHGGRELAVFRFDGGDDIVVVDNSCPHAGGNLSGGQLKGTIVTCRSHGWPFDLRTGACVHSGSVRVGRYAVELRAGFVYVDLDTPL